MSGMGMNSAMTHHAAARMVRRTQLAGLVVALGAAGLWAVDVPGLGSNLPAPDSVQPPIAGPTPSNQPEANSGAALDAGSAYAISQNLDVAARRQPKPEQGPIARGPEPTPEPTPSGPDIRYLGLIEEPSRRVALLAIDGRQRMLAEGRKSGDITLTSVEAEQIRVSIGREQRVIPLADRSGPSVAWVSGSPGGGAGAGGMQGGASNPFVGQANPGVNVPMPGAAGKPGAGATRSGGRNPNGDPRRMRDRENAPDDGVKVYHTPGGGAEVVGEN